MYADTFGDHSSTSGFAGADIGLLGHNEASTFSYGIAAKNLGSAIGEDQVPVKIAAGLAYRVLKKNVATLSVDIEQELVDLPESATSLRLGAEYLIANTFAIRGGSKVNTDRRQFLLGLVSMWVTATRLRVEGSR